MDSQDLINRIASGDEAALEELYLQERSAFLSWAKKQFSCSEGEAKELYQVIVLIVYDNIVLQKLTSLSCSIRSYLYAVAKNKWKEWLRARTKTRYHEGPYFVDLLDDPPKHKYSDQLMNALYRCLQRLGNPCQKLLESYYYKRQSMHEISEAMGYKNASTTKNLKYKCLQRLKKMMASLSSREITISPDLP